MRSIFTAIFSVFLLFAVTPSFAAGDNSAQAKNYMQGVANSALDVIMQTRSGALSPAQAKVNFRTILNRSFDIPTIAKFTMGRYWRVATPAEQAQFISLLKANILDKYADSLLDASGDRFNVESGRMINDTDYAVKMTGFLKSGEAINFDWRLRQTAGNFKIIDVAVEGVSMSVTHRSDFASVIERNGGQVQALLTALQKREFAK